jgi:hypothetical protein
VGLSYREAVGDLPAGHPQLPAVLLLGSPYMYHQGDLIDAGHGTGNYVWESPWELPTQNIFGGGGVIAGWWRKPNTFSVRQAAPPVYVPQMTDAGLDGLIAGQFSRAPLMDEGGRYAAGGHY